MKLLVIGATGLVGRSMIKLLENSEFKIDKICFVASIKSRNKLIKFNKKNYLIKTVNDINFSDYTHALTLTSSVISKQIIPSLLFNNLIVIDNSSAYRNSHYLTIAELNFIENKKLYINPNCCVIQCMIPLFYLNKSFNISKIIYNTYQSCSGGGYNLLDDFNSKKITKCIPLIGEINSNYSTTEEIKMVNESKKILNKNINIAANCVRVPVDVGHLVNVIFKANNCTLNDVLSSLESSTIYVDDISKIKIYDDHKVYTTRLKQIDFNTFSFYTYSNNLLRGAAYNTYQTLIKTL